jgi:hypothetical protein
MIEQVLQRTAVLQQLQRVKAELSRPAGSRRRSAAPATPAIAIDGKPAELTEDDLRFAAEELAKAEAKENAESSGQPGFEPIANRRGGAMAPPLDDVAFVSREPALGLLQSALEQYHLDEKPASVAPATSLRRGVEEWKPGAQRRLLNEFSETDPGWVASAVAMGLKLFRKPHPFNMDPPDVRIGNQSRVLVVGDWGSGIERAQTVGKMMRAILDEGRQRNLEQHVVHLGDVYYSGWGWECDRRFLKHWPVNPGEESTIVSWSLNGNHDMYSGGYGYFDRVLADPRFSRQQAASYFRLLNDNWQLLGLDTAYKENVLFGPQTNWIQQHTTGTNRKTILMSHHQPFTVYEKHSIALDDTLKAVLRSGSIHSWLFGHEHRCILYSEHLGIKYPRLIGHGGVPVYMTHKEGEAFPPPVAYEYRRYLSGGPFGLEHWAPFGFAVLELDGPRVRVRYHYEDKFIHPAEGPELME